MASGVTVLDGPAVDSPYHKRKEVSVNLSNGDRAVLADMLAGVPGCRTVRDGAGSREGAAQKEVMTLG